MKIYTKQGDSGETQVYAKQVLRVSKDDQILDTYGNLDELNSHIGLLLSLLNQHEPLFTALSSQCEHIQQAIFQIGFAISDSSTLSKDSVTELEHQIDLLQSSLPAQTRFILPGGSQVASQAHICRTVCRRAERSLVGLSKLQAIEPCAQAYINRLSDYLFVVARTLNAQLGIDDVSV